MRILKYMPIFAAAIIGLVGCHKMPNKKELAQKDLIGHCGIKKPTAEQFDKHAAGTKIELGRYARITGNIKPAFPPCPIDGKELQVVEVPRVCPPSAAKCDGVSPESIETYKDTVARLIGKKKISGNSNMVVELKVALKDLEKQKTVEAEKELKGVITRARALLLQPRPDGTMPDRPKNGMGTPRPPMDRDRPRPMVMI